MKLFGCAVALILILVLPLGVRAQVPEPVDDTTSEFQQILKDFDKASEWRELVCIPKRRVDCALASCSPAQPSVHVSLNRNTLTRGTISRCSGGTCDKYGAVVVRSGIFTVLQTVEPRGYFVKVRGEEEYVEVASSGLGILISSGECRRIR